jgi:hypothetical protein
VKVLFTSGMRLGDSLHVLPIASWYSKTYGVKVDWAVMRDIYSKSLVELLSHQAFIGNIHTFHYEAVMNPEWTGEIHSCHRPFHKVGKKLNEIFSNIYDEVFEFGYDRGMYETHNIRSFYTHLAEEHNFGVDLDFKLEYGLPDDHYKDDTVKLDKMYAPILQSYPGVSLSPRTKVLQNLRWCAGAKEVVTTRTGAAIMLALARIPFTLVFFDNDLEWYLELCHEINAGITVRQI